MNQILYLVKSHRLIDDLKSNVSSVDATVLAYDAMRFVSALQGILNRNEPTLYLITEPHDTFWLNYMSEDGKLLSGYQRKEIDSFEALLSVFSEDIARCGLVLWDPNVPATVNVAGTIAGVEDMLPVRASSDPISICQRIIAVTGADVRIDLCGKFTGNGIIPDTERRSTGSAKCDAYVWALEHYLDRTHPTVLFYTVDGMSWSDKFPFYPDLGNAFVYNQDYAVYKRAFVFDLSCWGDEVPCDDKTQPLGTDLAVMKEILQRKYLQTNGQEMITVCGFNPWHVKYTRAGGKGSHGEVESEWRFTEILSAYNCIKDADAAGYCSLANASIYCQYPLKERYQNRRPKQTLTFEKDKRYVLFYIGDYDASAWTARFIPRWYADPALGQIPMMWCFNTNLSDRIPQAFDFVYERYSDQDYFAAGDSGAGYNNPRLCYEPRVHSDNPSCINVWSAHNKKYFERFDQNVIGFVIDGDELLSEREMQDMSSYASLGVGYLSLGKDLETKIVGGSTFIPVSWDVASEGTSTEDAVKAMLSCIRRENDEKRFFIFRTILCSPSRIKAIMELAKEQAPDLNLEFLDPVNFFTMAKQAKLAGLCY